MAPLTVPLDGGRRFPGAWCRCCGHRLTDVATVMLCSDCFMASTGQAGDEHLTCTVHGNEFNPQDVTR